MDISNGFIATGRLEQVAISGMSDESTAPQTGLQPAHLRGRHSQREGRLKLRRVICFAAGWGYITADIANEIIGRSDRSYASRLAKRGFLRRVETTLLPGGALYLVTPRGAYEAGLAKSAVIKAPRRLSEIPVRLLRHDLAVQRTCAPAASSGAAVISDKLMGREHGDKAPDAILNYPDGRRLAVEVELTPRGGHSLELALWRHLVAMRERRWDAVTFVFAESAARDKYEARLALAFPFGGRDPDGNWHSQYFISQPERSRFQFQVRPELVMDTDLD